MDQFKERTKELKTQLEKIGDVEELINTLCEKRYNLEKGDKKNYIALEHLLVSCEGDEKLFEEIKKKKLASYETIIRS